MSKYLLMKIFYMSNHEQMFFSKHYLLMKASQLNTFSCLILSCKLKGCWDKKDLIIVLTAALSSTLTIASDICFFPNVWYRFMNKFSWATMSNFSWSNLHAQLSRCNQEQHLLLIDINQVQIPRATFKCNSPSANFKCNICSWLMSIKCNQEQVIFSKISCSWKYLS